MVVLKQNNPIIIRTYTHTAKLSKTTHKHLDDFLNQQTLLWNRALENRINAYKECGITITKFEQFNWLTTLRANNDWFSGYHLKSQRSILKRLDKAFQNFFRRVKNGEKPGYPKFKSGRRKVRSFETDQFNIKQNKSWLAVSVKGIGRFRFKGKLQGKVKQVRIVKTARRVKIQLITEQTVDNKMVDKREPIGIDVGINNVVALSNGTVVAGESLHNRKKKLNKKKHLQRKVARTKLGSNSRKKARLQLSKECQRLAERENGRLHELSARIIRDHGSSIIVEDLNIPNMTKKGRTKKGLVSLNRSILEQKWGALMHMLSYKAKSAGGMVIKVPPHYTSQTCSVCFEKQKIGLNERVFRCGHCGHEEDRDVNAAKNILRAGLALLTGSQGGRPDAPGRIGASKGTQDSSSKQAIWPASGGRLTGQNSMQCDHCI